MGTRGWSRAFRLVLAAAVVADILVLTLYQISYVVYVPPLLLQALLVVCFATLTLVDFRAATAIAIAELACFGASGHWAVFPGGVSGRIVLDAILLLRGLMELGLQMARGNRYFGRYTLHALAVALILPMVWMTLGLLNGNRLADAFGDGNGHIFFAFALVIAALAQYGDLGWLRRALLLATALNACITLGLAIIALSGTPLDILHEILLVRLDTGGVLQLMPSGLPRLLIGSGLYLQVGVALVAWELLRAPRRWWPWAFLVLLLVDLATTWTRGYWLGAALALGFVLVVGSTGWRRPVQIFAAAAGIAVVLGSAALATGSSVPFDLLDRALGVFGLASDPEGAGSTATKIVQAGVLLRHIAERPIFGWGFGTIAPDYPYGQLYTYELWYLDLAYKTGIVGLLVFLSFPVRLFIDSVRGRVGKLALAVGVSAREAAVPGAIILSLLVVGATNPYLVGAYGLAPIVLCIAWLDPFEKNRDNAS